MGVSGAGIRLDVVFPGVHLGTERGVVAAPQAVRVLGSDHGAVFPAQSQTYFAVSHAATHQGAMRLGVVRVRCSLAAGSAMVLRCDLCAMWVGREHGCALQRVVCSSTCEKNESKRGEARSWKPASRAHAWCADRAK